MNDPYACVTIGGNDIWSLRTNALIDAGSNADWDMNPDDEKSWNVEVTKEQLLTENLKVMMLDANKHIGDKLIGEGEIPLKELTEIGVGGKISIFQLPLILKDNPTKLRGRVYLTLCLDPSHVDKLCLPIIKDFTKAILCITGIDASNMVNVEKGWMLGDQNDPYARVKFGRNKWEGATRNADPDDPWFPRTPTLDSAGSQASWTMRSCDKKWRIPVTREDLEKESLYIELKDYNEMSKDVMIGNVSINLSELAKRGIRAGPLQLNGVLSKASKKTGNVQVHACLEPYSRADRSDCPGEKNFTSATLSIRRIEARGLANVEVESNIGVLTAQAFATICDPYTQLKLTAQGRVWPPQTLVIENAGSNADWEINIGDSAWRVLVSKKELLENKLTVDVYDSNKPAPPALVGSTSLSLTGLVDQGIGGAVQLIMGDLKVPDEPLDSRGRVFIGLYLEPPPMISSVPEKVEMDFVMARLCITRIEALGMKNVEKMALFGNGNDPYAFVSYLDNQWEGASREQLASKSFHPTTSAVKEGGANAAWDIHVANRSWHMIVSREELKEKRVTVTLMDKNTTRAHTKIGDGTVSLLELLNKGINGGSVTITTELKEKGVITGTVKITVILRSCTNDYGVAQKGSSDFETAMLCVKKIEVRSLAYLRIKPLSRVSSVRSLTAKDYKVKNANNHVMILKNKDNLLNSHLTIAFGAFLSYQVITSAVNMVRYLSSFFYTCNESMSILTMKVWLPTMTISIIFVLVAHRIFSHILFIILRYWLSKNIGNDEGSYQLHASWVSVRGLIDRQEIVIRNFVWENHPIFDKTPFFISIRELRASFDIMSIYNFVMKGGPIMLDRVYLEGLEVHIEKAEDGLLKNVKEYTHNFWGALGIAAPAYEPSIYSNDSEDEEEQKGNEQMKEQEQVAVEQPVGDVAPEIMMNVNHLIIFGVVVHPLDLIHDTHAEADESTDIRLGDIIIHRKDVIASLPKADQMNPPRAVTLNTLVGVIVQKVLNKLLATNKQALGKIVGRTFTNRFKTFFSWT